MYFCHTTKRSKHFIYAYNVFILLVEPWCEKESMLPAKVEILGISFHATDYKTTLAKKWI
jgi:hypothetical protein